MLHCKKKIVYKIRWRLDSDYFLNKIPHSFKNAIMTENGILKAILKKSEDFLKLFISSFKEVIYHLKNKNKHE